jgi:hypothetical protein
MIKARMSILKSVKATELNHKENKKRRNYLKRENCTFFKDLPYIISGPQIVTSVASTSQVCVYAIFLLPVVGN